ncbi:MAG: PilC/PilY family type IV pilus protein [Smithellaceae bacterium]|jgi:hypothetical protein
MLNKKSLILFVVLINIIIFICSASNVWAQDDDESATFTSLAPDALIILDLSGSMNDNPAGIQVNNNPAPYGSSTSCVADTTNCANIGHSTNCSGGFCQNSQTNCNVNCSKVAIAQRALFNILDDNNNGTIDSNDSTSLNIRIGFMRYYNCSGDVPVIAWGSSTKSSGCAALVRGIGSAYSQIYCNNTTSCASTVNSCNPSGECIIGEQATGGTPLASTLKLAKNYLDYNKSQDNAQACRLKFVILMTDGADTYSCSGNGGDCQAGMYERRVETVAAAKQLGDAGYKVYVIGFGSTMPAYLQNTLNWMSYYGGTNNPLVDNTGDPTAYSIPLGCNANPAVPTACCNFSTNPTACYPSGVTSCMTTTNTSCSNDPECGTGTGTNCTGGTAKFYANTNDPGLLPLGGYAFLAQDGDTLTAALEAAFGAIRNSTYSFTQASIPPVRTTAEDYLYEASFQPLTYDPFWPGHLMRYTINADGSIANTADWDAAAVLSAQSARTVLTYKAGSLIAFNSTNLTPADFGVTTTTKESLIVNFILNGETSQDVTNWKLGDIFHSSPMAIGTPNSAFYDRWDQSNPKAFTTFLNNNIRTTSNGMGIILVGDNDGQLHAFRMGAAGAGGGSEAWSFIPPNLLSQLADIAHNTHPTSLIHTYFVDGPLSAADVWLGMAGPINTTYKSASDWHTYSIMSEGRGGNLTLWSSATDCESGFSSKYSSTYTNYCGYYAFDVTNTLNNPVYKWRLGGSSGLSATDGAYLGQPWSKMYIGRVLINNTEKWVGLIGGGYSGVNCPASGTCDTRGKGFYVVDLSNGSILWRYTNSNNASMKFDLAAGPVAVDYDNDGFLDTAYIGDLGGNVWRFKFCLASDGTSCNTANWSGGLLFSNSSTNQKIFSSVAVTIDQSNNLWVYFGTGDNTDPTVFNATNDSFYAIKDNDRSTTYYLSNLVNITSGTYTDSSTRHGWYINLASGEKVLSAPNINFQNIYFTTFTPPNPNNPCDQSGNAQLYIINYITGAGVFANNVRSETIGIGIPNSPIVSRNPYGGTDIYVSSSQVQSGSGSHTQKETDPTVWPYPPNNLIYWRDIRLQ